MEEKERFELLKDNYMYDNKEKKMNKQNYAVCCYTCEHNGKETCKGCNTILNGENEPYENWQLREDLCQKDKHIKELEIEIEKYKLDELADAVADLGMPKLTKHELWQSIEQQHSKNMTLEKLLEKANDEKLELEQSQKQLAISELEKLKEKALHFYVNDTPKLTSFYVDVKEIDSQIKSLKGEE